MPPSAVQLAATASLEIGIHELHELAAARHLVPDGQRLYVSHLPKQPWAETLEACKVIRASGLKPIPHVPVRLISDHATLDGLMKDFVAQAGVEEVLLISGDYADSVGPYASVVEVLRTDVLRRHGIQRVSLAGHPEGHPRVPPPVIRQAERDKCALATAQGLSVTLLTQFFFEAEPFVKWAHSLRQDGVTATIVAGLAGPTRLSHLIKLAARCGVGPSIRALTARPSSLLKTIGQHGPEDMLQALAQARVQTPTLFDGIHLFTLGGFQRTCEWLHACAVGESRATLPLVI